MSEKYRVFIADDEVETLESLKKSLTLSGFEVRATFNPREIIKMIKEFKPDVVLLDLLMPDIGGFEICHIIDADIEIKGIPIIIISALSGYTDIKNAYELGVVGYFTKPYDYNKLVNEINKIVARR
jgi:PleD family two-component response regulator